jgi:hypothetical protein
MSGDFVLGFGAHSGKTLREVAGASPSYLLWIAGINTKFALTSKGQELRKSIEQNHPEAIVAAKSFLEGKCRQCWQEDDKKHFCAAMKSRSFYEYHPYGKRT